MRSLVPELSAWIQRYLGLSPETQWKLLLCLAVWVLYALARVVISGVLHRRVEDVSRRYFIGKALRYVIGISALVATLMIWFGSLTGFAAYLGIVSAGLAIALQDAVTNLAGWIFIAVRKPFVVGDRVEIGGHRGDVIDTGLFQFSLMEIGNWVAAEQSTGRIIHVPNGWVFKNSTANYTKGLSFIWDELAVLVTFESDWRRAKGLLEQIVRRHGTIESRQAREQVRRAARDYMIHVGQISPIVWTSVLDSGVNLTLRFLCDPRARRSTEEKIWEDVLDAFAAEPSIDFAYPTTRFYDNRREGKPGAGGPSSAAAGSD